MKDTIKQIIIRFQETNFPRTIERNAELPINSNKVISVIGPRRSGKTYLLYDTAKKIIKKGVPKKNILFINFEDERLQLETKDLDLILQAWRELHNGKDLSNHYFFFDEIQNINGWEKFIRRIYDTETQNIYITGSNSNFLATEIATSLRGRSIPYEVFPFSFYEYLNYKGIETNYYSEQNKAKIINQFYNYLQNGGFPETISIEAIRQNDILRTYYYVMLYKDLIERYNIPSAKVIKYFIEKLADNMTKHFSINKIYNDLRSQGLKLNKNSLYDYLGYVENIYLAFSIQKYDYSLAARSKSNKKAYFIDNGLYNILTHNFSQNSGKLLENAVFLFLRSKYGNLYEKNIFYFKGKQECDFVIIDRNKPQYCIQISYDISDDETRKREIKGLIEALNFFDMPEGYIITAENEEEITIDGKHIFVKPAYKIMIDGKLD